MASERFDLIVRGGSCVTPEGVAPADLGVRAGRITRLGGLGTATAEQELDASGLHVLPGIVDSHVHLREPGMEHKEDLATGTLSAVLGGVTAVLEMPNTAPATTGAAELEDKLRRARRRVSCDVGFLVGATPENVEDLPELERLPGCAGVKLFMGRSTGGLLVDQDRDIRRVLESGSRRVAVHAEDEARLQERRALIAERPHVSQHDLWRDGRSALLATERVLRLAAETGRRVHLLHVTTAEELELLARHRDLASVECTPQHLTLAAPECYERLGTRAQMNPPIRAARHREALWRAVAQGTVDVVGSDHAPHTLEEKQRPYPESPSGMPGVQTLLPLLLDAVSAGRLSLERLVELCASAPARLYGLTDKGRLQPGADADFTVVDLGAERVIEDAWIASRCGWTPFAGRRVRGWPRATVVRGRIAVRDGEALGDPAGRPLAFSPA